MRQRAQLFSARQLQPSFPTGIWEPDLACVYRDDAGRTYRYYADTRVHRMVGPDGGAIYERVTGVTQFATDLTLPGWPAATDEGLLGLNSQVRYALVPGGHDSTQMQISSLPPEAMIERYYGDARFTLLRIGAAANSQSPGGEIMAVSNLQTHAATLNDAAVDAPAWPEGANRSDAATWRVNALPARLVLAHAAPAQPGWDEFIDMNTERAKYVDVQTGLDAGERATRDIKRNYEVPGVGEILFYGGLNWGGEAEVVMDYLVTPPGEGAVLEVFTHNTQDEYGNGTIARLYVNGQMVHEHDFGPQQVEGQDEAVWDLAVHRWRMPLDVEPGIPVLLSIATDGKGSNNADYQWWSAPRFIEGPAEAEFAQWRDDAWKSE